MHFAPGVGFRHNAKVALAVVPSALTLAGGCGGIFLATSLVGAMIAYVLDALELAEASLVSAWIALLAAYVAVCAGGELFHPGRPPWVSLLLLLLVGVFLLLVGLWTSLQFLWVRRSFPGVTLAAERLLFAALPHVAGGILAWALVDAFGAAAAPSTSSRSTSGSETPSGTPSRRPSEPWRFRRRADKNHPPRFDPETGAPEEGTSARSPSAARRRRRTRWLRSRSPPARTSPRTSVRFDRTDRSRFSSTSAPSRSSPPPP